MKEIIKTIKKNPSTFSAYCLAISTGLITSIKTENKSLQTKVLSTYVLYLFGTLLGFLGFKADEKLNKKRKAN